MAAAAAAAADAEDVRVGELRPGVWERDGEMGDAAGVDGRGVMEEDLEWNLDTGVCETE